VCTNSLLRRILQTWVACVSARSRRRAGAATLDPREAAPQRDNARDTCVRLALLGSFDLRVGGESVPLPMNGQRVLAFLALQRHSLQRSFVAGSLWLDSGDDRAAGSLRSALWRLNRRHRLVEARGERLRLAADVAVDVDDAVAQAHRVLDLAQPDCPSPRDVLLLDDLLPDWYDDWVALERERFRQLRTHALERLCDRLIESGRFGEAVEAGLAATKTEPLRESAHRALVRVHLAEGNRSEALRQYLGFRRRLRDELGLDPSPHMEALVASITGGDDPVTSLASWRRGAAAG
jgi:DNA-binding SARP family transcriptional activator